MVAVVKPRTTCITIWNFLNIEEMSCSYQDEVDESVFCYVTKRPSYEQDLSHYVWVEWVKKSRNHKHERVAVPPGMN
jgi:hypothetical protein